VSKRVKAAQPFGCQKAQKFHDPNTRAIARAARHARNDLAVRTPHLSAKSPAGRGFVVLLGAFDFKSFKWAWLANSFAFGGLGCLRAWSCVYSAPKATLPRQDAKPKAVPIWTVLIALYNEADSVPSLLAAISQLNWASNRLDVIFACEHDDETTLAVLVAYQQKFDFRIVRVPGGGPRTKPNALQTALPFARGRYLTVYDAEDRPDPEQLRAAFQAFLTAKPDLAVVQAPLVTWNHAESWIARQFALDYAIWFRVILPAFSRVSGLIPLGGTSNHFRTSVLRKVGGWDPHNVTEDADLGVRLARHGFRAGLISPPTLEEAPPRLGAWVKQRGRWIQGHIQTASVHLRTPVQLWRDIGLRGVLAFFLGLGVGPLSALIVLPLTIGVLVGSISLHDMGLWVPMSLGFLGSSIAAATSCYRDGRWSLMLNLLTLPLYHCLQSVAACRAMWRVVFTPSFWDKTDHGCAARAPKDKGKHAWIGQRH
jgi:glycosyltransferase XagB